MLQGGGGERVRRRGEGCSAATEQVWRKGGEMWRRRRKCSAGPGVRMISGGVGHRRGRGGRTDGRR